MKELYSDLNKMLNGLNRAADAVTSTLGPDGRNVFISDIYTPKITNDGARIADSIAMKDPLENAGAYLVKNCAAKTNDDVGDGTTTTVVLLQALIRECLKRPESRAKVRESLNEASKKAIELLKKKAIKMTSEDIREVALISGEYPDIADLITEILGKIGNDALIMVEDSRTYETTYELVEGYEAKAGFVSPWFMTDQKSQKAEYEDIPVFVTTKKISNAQDLNSVMTDLIQKGVKKCAFFINEIDERVLGVLVALKIQGKFDSIVVRTIAEELEDIAGATGAVLINENSGLSFNNVLSEHLGLAKKLSADSRSTLLISDPERASHRALDLEINASLEKNEILKDRLLARAKRLRGQIALLKIGANNDLAREHKKDKAQDAVKAVPAALAEGLVPGAGQVWLEIIKKLGNSIGEQILKIALKAPHDKILENSGNEKPNKNIKDPAKVERVALENAVEAAGIFITTAHAIVDEEQKQ